MPPRISRYVTLCQQLLVLGVVVAALTPAANVVSLDVVRPQQQTPATAGLSSYAAAALTPVLVPEQPVEPTVQEFALTPADAASGALSGAAGKRAVAPERSVAKKVARAGRTEITSRPQAVTGYGAVGVTWAPGVELDDHDATFRVRTRDGGRWSQWQEMEYHDDHGPDPDSAEARHARPGTDELLVGEVDDVQVAVSTPSGEVPDDLRLAVVDPGEAAASQEEEPAIDTGAPTAGDETDGTADGAGKAPVGSAARAGDDAVALQRSLTAPQPRIYSRAQWGANEKLRDGRALHYGTIKGGFVHHTVNANDYTAEQVPGIIRSIYAYHVKSRGWSDVGYNFLVDRFGRIWEGRYGGVTKAVVGAHTLGYNDYAFAMSAIGNFDVAQPPTAMVQAYGALMAWKLALHNVAAGARNVKIGSKTFSHAIMGHRDAGSTACPGRYLYAKLPTIRSLADGAQNGTPVPTPPSTPSTPGTPTVSFTGRTWSSDLVGSAHPDIVLRRASDQKAVIVPTGGESAFRSGQVSRTGWAGARKVIPSADLTGDRVADVVVIDQTGTHKVRPGRGGGRFGSARPPARNLAGHDLVTAVGNLDGRGVADLVARDPRSGKLRAFLGNGRGGFVRKPLGSRWNRYRSIVATGDVTGDGRVDVLGLDKSGRLWLHRGLPGPKLGARAAVPGSWAGYDTVTGYGDFTGDGRADLFVRERRSHRAYVVPGRGNGTFGARIGPFKRFRGVTSLVGVERLVSRTGPDLVGRKGGALVTFANRGTRDLGLPVVTNVGLRNSAVVLNAGDWDGDGHGDLLTVSSQTGNLQLRRGDGRGRFATGQVIGSGFAGATGLLVTGDVNRDGRPDLLGRRAGSTGWQVWPGKGTAKVGTAYAVTLKTPTRPSGYTWLTDVSDLNGDGRGDLVGRTSAGLLYAIPRTATGFGQRRLLGEGWGGYDRGA
ncbi:FG-GAP-like repeat-containing protein [Nocardioides sp. SYSU D00038]|uniref:FG-GAP-like repeat-containing protein n=1 Tax=Nocardioides sp. SYSU D00038 TaxID=2812554 RepID=UPI0019674072|nr:FG-GAP-like repeat-containing protein [Nocardioides sp. SYSU D00038]